MKRYGQYCPVAKTAEILGERWMLLVVRELLWGADRFGDLQRGLGSISSSVLATRLRELERSGLIERVREGGSVRYVPTDALRDLEPVVEAMGWWGATWMRRIVADDLDPTLLMLDIKRDASRRERPRGRHVVAVRFADADPGEDRWWLIASPDGLDVCDTHPGVEPDVVVDTTVRALTRIWMGEIGWADAVRGGDLRVAGPSALRRPLPGWLGVSMFASAGRGGGSPSPLGPPGATAAGGGARSRRGDSNP